MAALEAEVAQKRLAAEAEAKRKADAEAQAKAAADAEAKRKADAEAQAKAAADAEAKRKAEVEAAAKARVEAEARAAAEAEAKRRADADARAKAAAEADAKKKAELVLCQETITTAANSGTIRFATGNAVLAAESSAILDKIAAAAKTCPNARLTVEGHTDSSGNGERNTKLSAERAASVVAYLNKAGVEPWRLGAEGLGSSKPVASNDTVEGRAQNRRIAFVAALMSETERTAAVDAEAKRAAAAKAAADKLSAELKPCQDAIVGAVKSEPIRFRPGQSSMTREGALVLDRVAVALKTCVTGTITVEGHTDGTGDADEDKELSQARADTVVRYLTKAGFEGKRLKAIGYGRSKPVAANDSEENRAKNRRIVFIAGK